MGVFVRGVMRGILVRFVEDSEGFVLGIMGMICGRILRRICGEVVR
jgi:hypothetical protein